MSSPVRFSSSASGIVVTYVRALAPYLWEFRGRVLIALGCLLAAKLAGIGVPLLLKDVGAATAHRGLPSRAGSRLFPQGAPWPEDGELTKRYLAAGFVPFGRTTSPEMGISASTEALAEVSDFLVVITPGGAGTRHLINAPVLAALGRSGPGGGILVNVARGSVVDEAALIDALERGVIAGAGLDVFEDEPRVPERLRALPQVVLTPHVGSATQGTRQAMADLAFANLQLHLGGQAVRTPVPECR